MRNFEFYTPTKIIFGKDTESQVAEQIIAFNGTKVLVHYGGDSVKRSGLLDRVCNTLKEANLPYVLLGGVVPNPRLSKVLEGIELCKREGVDFILAVGGGSVIDSAKAIGFGLYDEGDVWDYFDRVREIPGCIPVGCILTIAGAGSEMSNSCVITNEDGWIKRGCSKSDFARPCFAILNPELTYTLPTYQTTSGIVDILMHTMERYFSNDTMEITARMSESLLKTVMNNAYVVMNNPRDYHARAEIMWAGSLSHNGLFGCGTEGGDWAPHQLGHELSGMFDAAHGASISAIWGSWARYVYQSNLSRFVSFATNVMDIPIEGKLEDIALAGIDAMEDFFAKIGMPYTISRLDIIVTPKQIEEMAEKCSFFRSRTIGTIQILDREDMVAIYTMAG